MQLFQNLHNVPLKVELRSGSRLMPSWTFFWTMASVSCLASLAQWQMNGDGFWLATAMVGLLLAGGLTFRLVKPVRSLFAFMALAAMAVTLGLALAEARLASDLLRAGEEWALVARNKDVSTVANSISSARDALLSAARTSAETGRAVNAGIKGVEVGTVVFDMTGRMTARSGQSRVILQSGPDGTFFIAGAFHDVLLVRASSGDYSAVASVVLLSRPPAERFARGLVASVTSPEAAAAIRLSHPVAGYPIDPADVTRKAVLSAHENAPVLVVSAQPRSLEEARLAGAERARVITSIPLFIAAILVLVTGWRRPAGLRQRLSTVAGLLFVLWMIPLGALSNVSPLFSAANYYSPIAGPFTANIAALTLAAFLFLLAFFRVLRDSQSVRSRQIAVVIVVVIAIGGPFVLRDLSRGIMFPPDGPDTGLWVAWQLAIALAAAGVLSAVASAGQRVIGKWRGLNASIGPALAGVAALSAPILWEAPGRWPGWYIVLWILAIVSLALVKRGKGLIPAVAFVAGCGAVTLTWGSATRNRLSLAERDITRIGAVDEAAYPLLVRYAESVQRQLSPVDRSSMVRSYADSELAKAGYPASLILWDTRNRPSEMHSVQLSSIVDIAGAQRTMAAMTGQSRDLDIRAADDGPFSILVMAVPLGRDSVFTVAVPQLTWLLPRDPFAALTGIADQQDKPPPYRLSLVRLPGRPDTSEGIISWHKDGSRMHADARVGAVGSERIAHIDVELRGPDALIPRGALLVLLDTALVMLIWVASAMADGGLVRWLRMQRARWRRSYRSRLSIALLGFFMAPAAAFAFWEAYRLKEDDIRSRELLVREALRMTDLSAVQGDGQRSGLLTTETLAGIAEDAGGPMFAFREGRLAQASDPMLTELVPLGTLLPAEIPTGLEGEIVSLDPNGDAIFAQSIPLSSRSVLVGFRPSIGPEGAPLVMATAARSEELVLDTRRSDLAVLVVLVTLAGAMAAFWLSGVAARQLAKPIGNLRNAALAIAGGRPLPPLPNAPPAEFVPVFGAFTRMATDLSTSRAALEEARRRTEAVLSEVASGVVAVGHDGSVILANTRAEQLLGKRMYSGMRLLGAELPDLEANTWEALATRLRSFLKNPDTDIVAFELSVPQNAGSDSERDESYAEATTQSNPWMERRWKVSLTRISGGVVLTMDDVTELATAQRVLAWGEMARQVAHEIKNPLTPIRLGVQHLRRAWNDGRSDFGTILDTNVTRILDEIDHLDEIARAFSRYGGAPSVQTSTETVDVFAVVHDVVELMRLGESPVKWQLRAGGLETEGISAEVLGRCRADELREVILNLLENSRLADATEVEVDIDRHENTISIVVSDNGHGISPDVMPLIFQPHFSTRTSGSGLGLAISRRLLDSWGGSIDVASEYRVGTRFTIRLPAV